MSAKEYTQERGRKKERRKRSFRGNIWKIYHSQRKQHMHLKAKKDSRKIYMHVLINFILYSLILNIKIHKKEKVNIN